MSDHNPTSTHELDHRVNDGIHVRLLWCERDDRVWVDVVDTKNSEAFRIDVRSGDRVLDVFHHPFAYAASRGVAGAAVAA